jgi:hypothetical protein
MVGVAGAKGHKAGKREKAPALKGKVVSVAGDGLVVKQRKTHEQVTVPVGADTRFKGAAAKITDVKAGQRVRVRPATGTAKVIKVRDGKAKVKAKGKHKGKAGKGGGKKSLGGKHRGKNGTEAAPAVAA